MAHLVPEKAPFEKKFWYVSLDFFILGMILEATEGLKFSLVAYFQMLEFGGKKAKARFGLFGPKYA